MRATRRERLETTIDSPYSFVAKPTQTKWTMELVYRPERRIVKAILCGGPNKQNK